MSDPLALALALPILLLSLGTAMVRPRWAPEAGVAALGAAILLASGALAPHGVASTLSELGPTVGFLAALLVLAEGCRREGVFEAIGAVMSRLSGSDPRRLLALVFVFASAVTAVLSLDATVILLTPVVFATLARRRWNPSPHLYACAHLANSASLLLPVSNLTNLLAFRASHLSFTRFSAVMALPWLAAIGVEWVLLRSYFAGALRPIRHDATSAPPSLPAEASPAAVPRAPLPRRPLVIVGATLAGFVLSSPLSIAPVWIAAAGALALSLPSLVERPATAAAILRAAEPGFLCFVLALGLIVHVITVHGLGHTIASVLPGGRSLGDLVLIALISAVVANLVNNLPATLLLVPAAVAAGPPAVLAVLLGVNVGPNLTPTGSLATLLWRRVIHSHGRDVDLARFLTLGLLDVPAALVLSAGCLWLTSRLLL